MDQAKIKQAADANKTTRMVRDFLAKRKRNAPYTNFGGMRADIKRVTGKSVDLTEFYALFESWAEAGAGELDVTPKGTPIGFKWKVPPAIIGQVARGIKFRENRTEFRSETLSAMAQDIKKATVIVVRVGQDPVVLQADAKKVASILKKK